jgi:hypothetical protein
MGVSRRSVLKGAALAGAAVVMPPARLAKSEQEVGE